ncbi:MAG: hypothetical protein ACJZ46_03255 [Candidatus Thalassarchaeaceae archaeon]|jgi:hypothetical protein
MAEENKPQTSDTAHLYDSTTLRSSAPSRKAAAGKQKQNTEIPMDAIPEVHVPGWVESIFGGPVISSMKFLPPDKMVTSLQLASSITLVLLCFLTFMITPVTGTAWFAISNMVGLGFFGGLLHFIIIGMGLIGGMYGVFQRDQRALLVSYFMLIIVTIRFAGSKVEFGLSFLPEGEIAQKLLLILYAVFLVMFIELSSGIIRFSMLDTSIRTGEVYVMGIQKITSRYHKSLMIAPSIAGAVALLTLFINRIIPAIIGVIDPVSANRLRESVELTSVYGVALGTMVIFMIIAGAFAVNLPLRIQQFRDKKPN